MPPGRVRAEVLTLALDASLAPFVAKLDAAMKDPEIMGDVGKRTPPGAPLAYDPRFGMSEAEYKTLLEAMRNPQAQDTGKRLDVTFVNDGTDLSLQTDACSFFKAPVRIRRSGDLPLESGLVLPAKYVDTNNAPPFSPLQAYSWLVKTQDKSVEVMLGRQASTGSCLLKCVVEEVGREEEAILRYPCGPGASPAVATEESAGPSADASALCRASIRRYPRLSNSMLTACKRANSFSAKAVDLYTKIYSNYMSLELLEALLRIHDAEQEVCAEQIAKKYDGSITATYLAEACL
jgi:hypothetical protein